MREKAPGAQFDAQRVARAQRCRCSIRFASARYERGQGQSSEQKNAITRGKVSICG